jgi:hypothetical protein
MLMANFQMLVFKFLDPDLDSINLGPKDCFPFLTKLAHAALQTRLKVGL